MAIKVLINGAAGRMGRRLCCLAAEDEHMQLVGGLERVESPSIGKSLKELEPLLQCGDDIRLHSNLSDVSPQPDVIVDFSAPAASMKLAEEAASKGIALVIGTTGLTEEEDKKLHSHSAKVPMIHAMNYSLGVNLVFRLSADIAKALGDDFNIEIVEGHHNRKVDSPSGTAFGIADAVCAATGRTRADLVHGRSGQVGKRTRREIGMHAIRLGSIVGDHTIHFGSDFERIELTHKAQDRDVFAAGALRAAKWLAGKPPALYDMQDVLFGGK
ncbi:unnamed protein product [Vitrella brassicaformis CCMP3155]|uniref:4-hydroxy-tetrahydrodipicolinate reductase n=2 Tax=Vitrella brassicaformis TaxID=1169539 RepID=A0A0G4H1E5_VITBC|nr:unnamed protein product [Vitrella brassicaformis CCMP3155]|mmetsp:Transcript_10192/g.29426  ORF Transcript_10192/g.29426 Transcript_10192/m.29426 type:complete len:271 (+) Transcript_10192:112-924(+)|eukprot:CEM37411.1 unnamed protein product [Vitrella brassicaformis CCMP3155]